MEYTKGEWVLQRPYIDRPIVIVAGKRVGSRGVIAEVKMVKEQIANAYLIASAPDLYEACKELINAICGIEDKEKTAKALRAGGDAIAKSGGK